MWTGKNQFMKFRVTVEHDEDGKFVVLCPSLPGCISQGDDREEALGERQRRDSGLFGELEEAQ